MTFVLERDVAVAVDPQREDYTPNKMETLPAGTRLSEIDSYAKKQLSPEHFIDDAGSDKRPADWRSEAAQAKDDQQKAFLEEYLATHTHRPEA